MSAIAYDTFTQIPDKMLQACFEAKTASEIKALLYLCKRTYGYKKQSDRVSLSQFLEGITKADGTNIDQGCGIKSKSSLVKALDSLKQKAVFAVSAVRGAKEAYLYTMPVRPVPRGTESVPQKAKQSIARGTESVPVNNPKAIQGVQTLQSRGTESVPTLHTYNTDNNNSLLINVGTGSEKPEEPENNKNKSKRSGDTPASVRDYIQRAMVKQAELYEAGDMQGAREMQKCIEAGRAKLAKLEKRNAPPSIRERVKQFAEPPKSVQAQGPQRINPDDFFGTVRRGLGGPIVPERKADPAKASESVRAEIQAKHESMAPEAKEKAQGLFQSLMSRINPLSKTRIAERERADALVHQCEQRKNNAYALSYSKYLDLSPARMVQKLYSEHIDNPQPQKDEHNVKAFIGQVENMSQTEKAAVVDAFVRASSGKVKPRCLKPVLLNLWRVE